MTNFLKTTRQNYAQQQQAPRKAPPSQRYDPQQNSIYQSQSYQQLPSGNQPQLARDQENGRRPNPSVYLSNQQAEPVPRESSSNQQYLDQA